MQTAPGTAAGPNDAKTGTAGVRPPRSRSRRLSPITLVIATLVALLAIGTMVSVLAGLWPPKAGETPPVSMTPTSPYASGLKVEKAGTPRRDANQVVVPVRVTNDVVMPAAPAGVSSAPTPGPANIRNATVKVLFYDRSATDPNRVIVGSAIGNAVNLPYGQTQTIEVVAIGIGDFKDYGVYPDNLWTDKDPVKATPAPSGLHLAPQLPITT